MTESLARHLDPFDTASTSSASLSATLRSSRRATQGRCLPVCSRRFRLSLLVTQFRHSCSGRPQSSVVLFHLSGKIRSLLESELISSSNIPAEVFSFESHLDTSVSLALRQSPSQSAGSVMRCGKRWWEYCMHFRLSGGCSRVQSGPLAQREEVTLSTTCSEDCIITGFTLGILAVERDTVCPRLECRLPIQFLFVLTLVHQQLSLLLPRSPPHFHCSRLFPNARFTPSVLPTAPALRLNLQQTAQLPTMMFVILGVC